MGKRYKVLIYIERSKIGHYGGPFGYLTPFLKRVNQFESIEIFFLDSNKIVNAETVTNFSKTGILKKLLYRISARIISLFIDVKLAEWIKSIADEKVSHTAVSQLACYDAVFFHSCLDMYLCRDSLREYKGKVFIQSHSPKPQHYEFIEDWESKKQRFTNHIYRHKLENFDRYAFQNADVIIFPCEESEEPYIKKWKWYRNNRTLILSRVQYLLTVNEPIEESDIDVIDIRKKYNISKESTIFCFVGRHNKTKGYDVLKKIGKKFKNRKDIYFIICGNYKPKNTPSYTNWIELGQLPNPYSIIKNADYCLNLNKLSYFDLGTLEYLSLGKNLIISESGGNKKIIDMFGDNVFHFSSYGELVNIIKNDILVKKIKSDEKAIKEKYASFFNIDLFLHNFETMVIDSIGDNKTHPE